MKKDYGLIITYILLFCFFAAFVFISFISEGSYYGGDSYNHYFFSRYAVNHPEFLLNAWAKPLFTLLSCPFAHFGFTGMMIFNITAGMLSVLCAIMIARELQYSNLYLIIILCSFAPAFNMLLFSGMTEVTFALLLTATVLAFIKKKFIAAAIVISFIPFVRSEGIVFIPWLFALLLYMKQYKALPFLVTGIFIYSLAGGLVLNDFFWFIHLNPYQLSTDLYGHGSPFFYILKTGRTFGYIIAFLALSGGMLLIAGLFRKRRSVIFLHEVFLIAVPALIYFLMHSVLWWKGWMSVLGDERFMAGIAPLIAILGLKTFGFLSSLVKNKWFLVYPVAFIISIFIIYNSLLVNNLPVKINGDDQIVKEAVIWFQKSKYKNSKVVYYNPIVPVLLNRNPFDRNVIQEKVNDAEIPEKGLKKNSVIIWDSHFGLNEGKLSADKLKADTNLTFLAEFRPDEQYRHLYGHDMVAMVFVVNKQ